jgi:hypothetical protein
MVMDVRMCRGTQMSDIVKGPYDAIVAADIVYNPGMYEPPDGA